MKLINPLLQFILAFALCCALPSMAQTAQEDIAIEKFNIELFNRNKDGFRRVYTLPNGTQVVEEEYSDFGYIVDRTPLHSGFTYREGFNYQGDLIATGQKFYSFAVGVSRDYDNSGKLIREIDHDKNFAFSVENLAAKMMADYKIDILNSNNVYRLARGTTIFEPIFSLYAVDCYDLASPQPQQAVISFLVDGNTGETLHILHTNTKEPASVLNAYLEKIGAAK